MKLLFIIAVLLLIVCAIVIGWQLLSIRFLKTDLRYYKEMSEYWENQNRDWRNEYEKLRVLSNARINEQVQRAKVAEEQVQLLIKERGKPK